MFLTIVTLLSVAITSLVSATPLELPYNVLNRIVRDANLTFDEMHVVLPRVSKSWNRYVKVADALETCKDNLNTLTRIIRDQLTATTIKEGALKKRIRVLGNELRECDLYYEMLPKLLKLIQTECKERKQFSVEHLESILRLLWLGTEGGMRQTVDRSQNWGSKLNGPLTIASTCVDFGLSSLALLHYFYPFNEIVARSFMRRDDTSTHQTFLKAIANQDSAYLFAYATVYLNSLTRLENQHITFNRSDLHQNTIIVWPRKLAENLQRESAIKLAGQNIAHVVKLPEYFSTRIRNHLHASFNALATQQ